MKNSLFYLFIGMLACTGANADDKGGQCDTVQNKQSAYVMPDFADITAKIAPSVVSISGYISGKAMHSPRDIFEFFFEGRPRDLKKERLAGGSGFIYKKDGKLTYIVTNCHVIDEAEKLVVTIGGDKFDAVVVGKDASIDIAVLSIETTKSTPPPLKLADSDIIRAGQWIIAIGSQYGFAGSVTCGIISHVQRPIPMSSSASGDGGYGEAVSGYIQTDAAINPGNSGGPMCNTLGEVIGVNTCIYSQTGANIGLGFAMPSNTFKETVDCLIEGKKISRGHLGVIVQQLDRNTSNFLLGKEDQKGVMVTFVKPSSPADKASIQTYDIITHVNDTAIDTPNMLGGKIKQMKAGDKVTLSILRKSKEQKIVVSLGEDSTILGAKNLLGCDVKDSEKDYGVIVTSVVSGGLADSIGIKAGHLIIEINLEKITSVKDFEEKLSKVKNGKSSNNLCFVTFKPEPNVVMTGTVVINATK